ncbi:MAG: hypothetical protein HY540_01795 [Deltaproteobacteria bacterium]|nr:hypothetical protein [Deltaproteobacteria bacterium]
MTLLDFAAPAGALGGLGTVMGKYVQELKAVNILEMLGSRLGRGGRGVAFNVMGDLNFAIKLGTERDIGRQVQMLQAFGSRLKAAGIEQLRAATAMRGTDKNGRAFALLEKVEGEVLGETGFANLKHTEELADLMTDFFSRSGSEVGRMLGDNLRPAISYSLKTGRGFFGLSGDVVRSTDKAGKNIYTVIDPSGSNILGQ